MLSLQDKLRYYYITFSISARNSHYIIKPDRKAGELIWIEDWYQECKFLYNTMYTFFFVHLSQLFYFKFIYSNNILKCVNLIEIRFYSYFYTVFITPSFLVLWHHYEIPEVEFGGQYGYLRANNQHWLPAIIGHAKTNIFNKACAKWSLCLNFSHTCTCP
jgi:hypothetical protein